MISHETIHEYIDLYALDALEGEELAEFERLVQGREDYAEKIQVAREALAALVPDQDPPTHLWSSIESALDQEEEGVVVELAPRRKREWSVVQVLGSVAAAVVLVVSGVLLGSATSGSDRDIVAAAAEAAEAGATQVAFDVEGTTVAEVVLGEDGVGFVLPTDDLPALEASRTYQLWVINPAGDVISAGVLGNDPSASVFAWAGDVTGFALTREVAGGVVSSAGDVVAAVTDI